MNWIDYDTRNQDCIEDREPKCGEKETWFRKNVRTEQNNVNNRNIE